ncbi:amidohydrolase family protein [Limosilactobacillus avium]|uniref:amidohydrolase family protein n=1 Tax=Limosilactobacillus avium TaxID=2991831 RepID=UPI0024BBB50B|nr:amidohydrolase family protein [Limosilactobacillus avium]
MIIDVFAHILTPNFYQEMLKYDASIPQQYPFLRNQVLTDVNERIKHWPQRDLKQVVSFVNINPEDYLDPATAARLCHQANQELAATVAQYDDYFAAGVGMLPMNNIAAALQELDDIKAADQLVGVQMFTRHLGKSIADPVFRPVLARAAQLGLPILLHPVFDSRKPDNNIVFSWEYELSQAMYQLVLAGIFEDYPQLKVIAHHAGAMVPFFAGRINHILTAQQAADFKRFYVDTAILGNPAALRLTLDYYGVDHVLFGTDAPFGILPAGATTVIQDALVECDLTPAQLAQVNAGNYQRLVNGN